MAIAAGIHRLGALVVAFGAVQSGAEPESPDPGRTRNYKTYNVDTGAVVGESARRFEPLPGGGFSLRLEWKSTTEEKSGTQEYVLDAEYATLQWTWDHPHENTRYSGKRQDDVLLIEGTHNGEPVSLEIEIDHKPFFSAPSVGLEGFVRSGKKKMEFRTLRPTDLAEYKMKASVQETETISVNGQDIEAVRVKWGLTGFKSMFFSRTLWFRKSDGVYLQSQVSDGEYTRLVAEREAASIPSLAPLQQRHDKP